MMTYAFRRLDGGLIETMGTTFSGRITVLGSFCPWEVWRIAPGKVYAGQGRPFLRTPSRLMLVKVIGDGQNLIANLQRECKPGTDWARKRRDFLDEAAMLAGNGEALSRFKREG